MRRALLQSSILLCLCTGAALAELGPAETEQLVPRRGSGAGLELPQINPSPLPKPSIGATPILAPLAPSPLASAPTFVLRAITVEGKTVLDDGSIREIVAPYIDRPVSMAELEEIRSRLTMLYVSRGYINSGFTIPDQNVADGILHLRAVEGRVAGVEIAGTKYFAPEYFLDRLARGLTTPFRVSDLEREQQILLQDPLVRRINIELRPGIVPGEATAHADVLEGSPYSIVAQIANNQSPTVGEVRGQLQGTAANLLGVGDILLAQYGRSQGINDGAVAYSLPLASDETRINVRYDINGTVVITPALRPLHLTSTYNSLTLGISRPFYRTAEQSLTFGAGLERRKTQTFLLNLPFSFVSGADNGKTNVTAFRLYQDYQDRDAEHAFALRSTVSLGVHALGATVTPLGTTSKFVSWLTQAQYVRRLYDDWEGVIRADLQLSNHPLFPVEQFALGGLDTVRGYRQFLTVTDDAFFASGEVRIPFATLRLPYLSDSEQAGTLQVVPFYDFGRGWNVSRPTPYPQEISGVGIGLRWLIGSGVAAEVYYAKPLRHVSAGTSLEDRGIYFRITTKVY